METPNLFALIPQIKDSIDRLEVMNLKLFDLISKASATPPPKTYLSVKELAKLIKKSEMTIRVMTARNQVPFIRQGRRILFDLIEIENWLKSKSVK